MDEQGNPQPGWYPDPQVGGQQRWWDGQGWTDHTAPLAGQGAGAMGAGAGAGAAGVKVETWLWQSIVATVLCCLPLGIVAIVFSSQAQSALNVGDLATAQAKAKQAKTFTLISAGAALLGVVVWFVFVVAIGGTAFMTEF